MPDQLFGEPFGQEQLASNYPFADWASLTTEDGLAFSPAWVLDARVYPVGSAVTVGITSISIAGATAKVAIGDADTPVLATTSFPLNTAIPARLSLADPAGRLCGMLLVDPGLIAAMAGWPAGTHPFATGTAELVASVVVPRPEQGLRSIALPGRPPLAGNVWIAGAGGVTFQVGGSVIALCAIGDPLFVQRACGDSGFVAPSPLRTINSIGPSDTGGFLFVAYDPTGEGTILRIDQSGSTVTFALAGSSAVLPTG